MLLIVDVFRMISFITILAKLFYNQDIELKIKYFNAAITFICMFYVPL